MRSQNHLSTEAFDLLADLVGGQVIRYRKVSTGPVRRCAYVVGDRAVDTELFREIHDLGLVWPDHFDNLDDVSFHVTAKGYAYVRQLTDA